MSLDVQGILQNISLVTEQSTVLYPYLREVFINETPFITRTRREPAEGQQYSIISYDVRPRIYTLNAAIVSGDTTITLTDTTPLLVGDVLELIITGGASIERIEVTALPTATTATIRRAREGTTAIANDNTGNKTVTLIGNSRTGAEIDQSAKRTIRTSTAQYVQTFQNPVQVGGVAQAVRNTRLPAGISDVFSLEQKTAMTEMMRDEEYTSYYGLGEAPAAAGDRPKQKGLKTLISAYNSGSNVNSSGGASYTFLNFVAQVQKAIDGGGDPDAVICSTDFVTGLQTWGFAKQQINEPRASLLGLPIKEIAVPFASGTLTFIPSYQLKKGTAIILTSKDALVRYIRPEFWNLRGNRGDAKEGDFIADICCELGHFGWHSFVEGVTSYA